MANGAALAGRIAETKIPALAVGVSSHGAREIAAGGRDLTTESSRFRIASLTKPFTSAAVVLALTERSIPLSAPAIEFLPALAPDWRADPAITVEQLLGQVAGLRESVDGAAMAAAGDGPDALLEGARLVVRAGSERAPGERWSYYNGNYFLVGAALAAITGTSYETALDRLVLTPWGLSRTGFGAPAAPVTGWDGELPVTDRPYPPGRRPSGGLWSCVGDLLTFAERLLAGGSLFEQTHTPRTRACDPMTYGLGWAIGPSGQMYLNGRLPGYRTAILLAPAWGYASVALASQAQALPELAALLSDLQRPLTGDDLAARIDSFAA